MMDPRRETQRNRSAPPAVDYRGEERAHPSIARRRGGGLCGRRHLDDPGRTATPSATRWPTTTVSWPASPSACAATGPWPRTSSPRPTPGSGRTGGGVGSRCSCRTSCARSPTRRTPATGGGGWSCATEPPGAPDRGIRSRTGSTSTTSSGRPRPPPAPAAGRPRPPGGRGPVRGRDRRHARRPARDREVTALPRPRQPPLDRGGQPCLISRTGSAPRRSARSARLRSVARPPRAHRRPRRAPPPGPPAGGRHRAHRRGGRRRGGHLARGAARARRGLDVGDRGRSPADDHRARRVAGAGAFVVGSATTPKAAGPAPPPPSPPRPSPTGRRSAC